MRYDTSLARFDISLACFNVTWMKKAKNIIFDGKKTQKERQKEQKRNKGA